ncbi:MAG TPA: phosphate ABC transporter substrate-binding protein PstS [Ignavibacteriaceae bacterium]|nr:phosphate ABC transporter substrate-binding protein PstS [Ignavibacteriaceae bacterium]
MKSKIFLIVVVLMGLFATSSFAQLKLNGAGATFPYVIYSKWFDVYHQKTGIEFNYQSIGSGGGIKQVIEGTVDFGATDGPMTDEQLLQAKQKQGSDVLHIPMVMGGEAVAYNLPQVGGGLNLSPDVLADIYLGKILKWNDKRITAINKGKNLPNKSIIVTHRSDGSGTTYIFTDYLSKVSKQWETKVGKGTSVNWPVGLGGKGNEGVAGLVKQTEGAIGYIELAYAVQNKLDYANLQNKAGNFIKPSFDAVSAAALGAIKNMPEDFRVSITNADGKDAYPISGFTWLLIYKDMKDKKKADAVKNFLLWALTDGQKYAKELYYAPIPKELEKLIEKKVALISVKK